MKKTLKDTKNLKKNMTETQKRQSWTGVETPSSGEQQHLLPTFLRATTTTTNYCAATVTCSLPHSYRTSLLPHNKRDCKYGVGEPGGSPRRKRPGQAPQQIWLLVQVPSRETSLIASFANGTAQLICQHPRWWMVACCFPQPACHHVTTHNLRNSALHNPCNVLSLF